MPPLLSRRLISEAEVNALVNSRDDYFVGRIRKPVIGARLLRGTRVRGPHDESHFVCPEKEREAAGCGRGRIVCARAMDQDSSDC